jgi:hypothetical protein
VPDYQLITFLQMLVILGCISNLPPIIRSFGEGKDEAIEMRIVEMHPYFVFIP